MPEKIEYSGASIHDLLLKASEKKEKDAR
jgi:hypothetical protein